MRNCRICNKPLDAPWRHIANGKITEGCVAKCHDPYIHGNSRNFVADAKRSFRGAKITRQAG